MKLLEVKYSTSCLQLENTPVWEMLHLWMELTAKFSRPFKTLKARQADFNGGSNNIHQGHDKKLNFWWTLQLHASETSKGDGQRYLLDYRTVLYKEHLVEDGQWQ